MTVLDDIRMLLHSICHAPLKNTLEEHIEYIKGVQKQACAILSVLDAASSSDRSDNMSDTMSLLSLDPSVTFEQTMTTDLDVAVLHASPFLLRLPDKRYVPLPELNIKQEQHRLHRIFADSNRALRTVHGVMSVDSLRKVLDRNVTVLHFSGHGGGANEADQDFLVFEDCNATGLGHLIDSTTLQSILCSGLPTPSLKLVFVSSCHSRQVGEVFLRAGVQHVVCVKQNEKILDEVSIIFSQAFYHAILHGKTVPQAFAIAQTRVSAETTNQYKVESGKFVLLQRCRCDALERQDDCKCVFEPLFFDVPHGKFFNLQLHNAQKKYMLPALPPIVLGREMELHTLAMLVHAPGGLVTALDMTDEKVVELHRLAPSQAARLFLKKAPRACHRLDFPEEITKPLDVELTHHPLLAYLDGHPQAIALCASLLQDKTLPELTHAICSQTTSLPPLMTSLQVAISSLSDPDTMRFFALQGYLPAGALASDYRAMFDRDWERHASVLCRYSLLQKQHHFPIKCTPRQKDIHHEALLAALQDYDKYVSGTTRTMRPAMERSRSSVEESLQKTISHAHLQSLSILFSTFPFITSYARRWVRAPDAIRWTAHFAKSMRWTHQYIGTFSSFSNAAYLILDIHEANAWNCIERYEQGSNDMPSNLPTEPTSEHESSDSPNQATPDETSTGPSGEKPPLRKKKRQPKWASATASLACYFAHTLFLAGRHEGACRAVKSGLDIAKAHGLKTVQANLTKLWATILVQEKKVEEAKVQFGLALLLYRAGDNKIGQASTLTGIGMVHSRQGNLRAAHSSFTKALALYEWSNHVLGQLNCHQRLGHLEKKLKMGDEVELTQHYAASRRLQGDLNNKKEHELVRWVGHEMSLLLEISVDITKRLPSKIRTDDGKQHDDEDVSSFARRKSYDSTRRRPIGGAKIFL
ncbi:hypothetical protein DYB32_000897 [Aphanomyces invadans]|uniref:CHAT domain-containing protein n=1 Tax=Aphanomyces invadans TaxID=157072 RepID=A0A418B8I7_9STRA|nr:hypothetical protein DYB32_000897 [Aphanomyces invadans]